MRLKNELAMQRLLRLQKAKAVIAAHERRPSAVNEYTPLKGSPLAEIALPSERQLRHRQPVIELPKVPSSARNIVSLEALNQIKQLAV